MKEKDNTQEVAKLRNDIQTLRSNTQSRVNDSRGGPPQSNEGSDGDTMFRLTSDKGLLMFHKFSGVWYSSPFNIGPWTLEDSINELVQDITVSNITIEESTQTSMNISGVFTILNTGTFALSSSATITGLSHSDLDDVGSGTGLDGNVHTQYTGTWSIDASQTLTFSTPQVAGNISTGAVEVVLDGSSLVAGGAGLSVNESGYSFTLDNTLTLQPTASTSLHISSAFADKIKLTDNAKDVIIGSSNAGDLNLMPVDGAKVLTQGNNFSNSITTASVISGGTGYVNGTYTNVPLIANDSGINAIADQIIVIASTVAYITTGTTGLLFEVGETFTVNNTDIGGTGSGFTGAVLTINESWNAGMGSTSYGSGWGGSGWTITRPTAGFSNNEWMLEVDNLSVRGTLSVYELLINQIRATNGTLFVSSSAKTFVLVDESVDSAVGKIAFEPTGSTTITPYAVGDILLCQRVSVGQTADAYAAANTDFVKRILIHVKGIGTTETIGDTDYPCITFRYYADEFSGEGPPAVLGSIDPGDVFVRIGSTSDDDRESTILLTSDFSNAPYMDFNSDVNSWTAWTGDAKRKARIGNLAGASDIDPAS